jgi:hypothetical protein
LLYEFLREVQSTGYIQIFQKGVDMNRSRLLIIGAASLMLVACGGEPSEGDIRKVIDKSIDDGNQVAQKMGVKMESKVHSVKKIGCKSDGDKAYICDVEVDVEMPMVGRNKGVAPMRFVKTSDGWAVTR